MQPMGKRNIDDSFSGTRIDYLSEFDLVWEAKIKELYWCGGVVKNVIDDICVNTGKFRQCYKENEAAFVFWGAVPEADFPVSRTIELFDEKKWNNNFDGLWRK